MMSLEARTPCQRVQMNISSLRRDLRSECAGLKQQYENLQASGLKEWYHKDRGWFTRTDPLEAHEYLIRVLEDLEQKLIGETTRNLAHKGCDLIKENTSKTRSKDPEVQNEAREGSVQDAQDETGQDQESCCFYDISQRRAKSPSTSSPENTLGRTELERQYEQNWNSLVLASTHYDVPHTHGSSLPSARHDGGRDRARDPKKVWVFPISTVLPIFNDFHVAFVTSGPVSGNSQDSMSLLSAISKEHFFQSVCLTR